MKTILLLHGAMGSAAQLNSLKDSLSSHHTVHTLNFSGHGGKELPKEMSIQLFAGEVEAWMKDNVIEKVNIFGYSMGGYVALYLALTKPELVESIITLGTKLIWDEAIAAREVAMLQPHTIEQKIPKFAKQLAELHAPVDWKQIMTATATMLTEMGAKNPIRLNDFTRVGCKVLLILGDSDKMVSFEETVNVFRQLPSAQFAVFPGTPHQFESVDVEMIVQLILKFIE